MKCLRLFLASSISISQDKHLFPAIGFVRRADDIAHFVAVTTPCAQLIRTPGRFIFEHDSR
jgi:hypothetical protein